MAKELKAVVRTDKIEAYQAGRIHHLRVGIEELENGTIVGVGGTERTNLDTRKMVNPEEGVAVALVADPVKTYDESSYDARFAHNYSMEEGQVVRAYKLVPTDVFSVSLEGIGEGAELIEELTYDADDVIVEDVYAVATTDGEGYKLKLTADKPVDAPFVGKVIATEVVGGLLSRTWGQGTEDAGSLGVAGKTMVIIDVLEAK